MMFNEVVNRLIDSGWGTVLLVSLWAFLCGAFALLGREIILCQKQIAESQAFIDELERRHAARERKQPVYRILAAKSIDNVATRV